MCREAPHHLSVPQLWFKRSHAFELCASNILQKTHKGPSTPDHPELSRSPKLGPIFIYIIDRLCVPVLISQKIVILDNGSLKQTKAA